MSLSKTKDIILKYIQEHTDEQLTAEDLIDQIPVTWNLKEFWKDLGALVNEGSIAKKRNSTYGLPESLGLVAGRFQMTSKGFGFVIPDNKGTNPDIFIPPHAIGGAMNDDKVMARMEIRPDRKHPEGEIVRIIERAAKRIVGTFQNCGDFGFVVPDDKKVGQDIYILKRHFNGAANRQKVVAEITAWPDGERDKNIEGKITEVLGNANDPGMDILSIIKQYDLPLAFPNHVQQAAKRVPDKIKASEITDRRDLRDRLIVTIDGEDAKDLDDAVYVEKLENGDYLLGVYIADVSYYVHADSTLDKEARERGTSVYLVDRVLPMLPERLSNGICSLNAGEDRLAMCCEMRIDNMGKVVTYDIFEGVINVRHRLSYRIVKEILGNNHAELTQKYLDAVPMLQKMNELREILHNKRVQRGAIDFDLPEQKVILDETGKPVEIVKREHGMSESIIEEFMLAANETVAWHMHNREWPFVYRVHDIPKEDKMQDLALILNDFNIKLHVSEEIEPKALQQALKQMVGKPEERMISTMALRSLKQAVYQTDNIGHFGLAAEYYTHFTSPIRRYPDLIVHRLLREWMKTRTISESRKSELMPLLDDIAEHSSKQERVAADAERDTVELKMAEYMQEHIGETFSGVISGVTSFGMFVELDNGVEGLVHVTSLLDDYYDYYEERHALIGMHTKKVYRLGDSIEIEVLQVNLAERSVDFILAGEDETIVRRIKEQLMHQRSAKKPSGGKKAQASGGKRGKKDNKPKHKEKAKKHKTVKKPKNKRGERKKSKVRR